MKLASAYSPGGDAQEEPTGVGAVVLIVGVGQGGG